jgi:hypothetical protein
MGRQRGEVNDKEEVFVKKTGKYSLISDLLRKVSDVGNHNTLKKIKKPQ